jgi:hypothetical protein
MLRLLVISKVVPSLPILVTQKMEVICSSDMSVLQEQNGVASQKTAFFT